MKTTSLVICIAWILSSNTHAEDSTPGLVLSLRDTSGNMDEHSAFLPAIFVPTTEPASPFLEKGPFTATWSGYLHLDKRSRLYFSFSGNGKAVLKIDNEVVLQEEGKLGQIESERLRLSSGRRKLDLTYTSPSAGDSQFRLYWKDREFARETIPANVFFRKSHNLSGDTLRQARNLFAESGCIHCHKGNDLNWENAMPEISQTAPAFENIGNRLNKEWMAKWLRNPKEYRSNANMPVMLQHFPQNAAIDIAEWLSQKTDILPTPLPPSTETSVKSGESLFHSLGCFGCHVLKDSNVSETAPGYVSISLSNVGYKFQKGALRDFLMKPGKHYPWIRMPDFALNPNEATQLEHYLRTLQTLHPTDSTKGDANQGSEYVMKAGCLNCHSDENPKTAQFLTLDSLNLSNGCLSGKPEKSPNYNFTETERNSLKTFLETSGKSLQKRSLREFSIRQVEALQCNSCHPMNGSQSHLSGLRQILATSPGPAGSTTDQADTIGKKIEPPDLSLIGEKLRTQWMTQLFNAELPYKPRPWMKMRMPAFQSRGELLATGLSHAYGFSTSTDKPELSENLLETGQKLVSTNGGFACVACHALGKKPALAPFEGQGLNFSYTKERLTHEYYLRWMLNPQRISPHSIMPRYSDDEGISTLSDILNGNATDQFNAIWKYLESGHDL